jgi:pyruvate/2-oxoglutarate/acetoin dehydrogenase E1 component
MTGGAISLPLTVRTQFGSGRPSGSQPSQSLEALLAHIPVLTVVMPSTPADAYGLLRAAIHDPNPVIVIENRALYTGALCRLAGTGMGPHQPIPSCPSQSPHVGVSRARQSNLLIYGHH